MAGLVDAPSQWSTARDLRPEGGGSGHQNLGNNASGSDSVEQLANGQRSRNFSTFGSTHLAGFWFKAAFGQEFQLSTDPMFVEKVRDIVGLYPNPPEKAIVLCVDEKSQTQALERTQPILPMRPGVLNAKATTTTAMASCHSSVPTTWPPDE